MVTIKDGCGCDPCDCDWKQKLKEAYSRAIQSVNKIGDNDGSVYYPDGTGFVKLPLPRQSDVTQIKTNAQDIADLKVQDIQLQANITTEETARKAKDDLLDADITRIDNTDAGQDQRIRDNADKITSTYNDLVSTEATVATHDSEIITLKANNQALAKSLVSDVMMTDGTTAGSVQVSIEREDGALITSANYKWGKDIGVRLEAGTQAGYIKTVISLSDGTVLESNEYKIVEVLESDVYVTAITLVPDMTAGTIGGNISYSNGTIQTINTINVPTAPGVTSAIEALQSRMTAVEQKNTTQDADITSLKNRVQTIEDTPGVGQFGAGKLGTIAGSTTDGRIKAEDDGTGSVNGWSALKQRVTTAEGQITTAQNDISALDGLVAGKVDIMQGTANAGKALIVGSDGNVAPGEVSGGEVWEEVDLSNFPTDWTSEDRIKIQIYGFEPQDSGPSSWSGSLTLSSGIRVSTLPNTKIIELRLDGSPYYFPVELSGYAGCVDIGNAYFLNYNGFNSTSGNFGFISITRFNGSAKINTNLGINRTNLRNVIYKMWRLKK